MPYGFLAYMVAGAAWFFLLKSKASTVLLRIRHDLEAAAGAAVEPPLAYAGKLVR